MNIFLSDSTDIFAGGEDYVLTLAKQLKQRGHSVWVSARPSHLLLRKCEDADIPTVPLAYRGMARLFVVAGLLRKELHRRSIDIIHSNANYDRTCAAMAAAGTSVRHVASIHSAHSIQYNITHWLRNRLAIDHFVVVPGVVKDILVEKDGISAERISVVPIGVENTSREFQTKTRAEARAHLGVSAETLVIGNVARLVPFKGHSYLLQAIAEIVSTQTNVLFTIIGEGELRDDLKNRAADLGIDKYVRFMGFRDDLSELYPAFDIYCHSSIDLAEEAFPIAILRALAAGLPVACTLVGGIGSMVEDGVSGFLTRPADPHALAGALRKLIGNAALRISMGKASYNLFETNFHASVMAERVEQVYTHVLSRGTSPGALHSSK